MSGAIISILIYLAIFYFAFKKIRKAQGADKKQAKPASPAQTYKPTAPAQMAYRPTKKKNSGVNAHMAREKINIGGWEDRRNDWLARQMAEERIAARRMSEMFQLKQEHHYNCEAEMLRQFHEVRCEANEVDNGEHK